MILENIENKKCSKCSEMKNKNEYIKKCGMCPPCRSVHRKEYRLKNIEKFKEKDKKYYEKNREKIRERDNNYYKENREKIQKQRKIFRENNIEYHKEKQRMYYLTNTDKRIGINYRNRVREKLKSGKGYLDFLGCSITELIKWFEYNFTFDSEFNWENYGKVWEIDHVIPCARFNLQNKEEIFKCFSWTNTKPVTKNFNRRKSNNIIENQVLEQNIRINLFTRQFLKTKNLDTAV